MSAIASHPDIGSGVKSKTLVLHQAQDLYAEVDIETYPKLAVEVLGGIDVVIFIGAGPPIPSSFVDIEEEVYDYEKKLPFLTSLADDQAFLSSDDSNSS